METVKLKAEPRTSVGSRVSRRLRKQGFLPAIVYGHGEKPEAVSLAEHEVELALHHGARILDVTLGGSTQKCLIKEVQYDHLDLMPIHLDLARVSADERVRVKVGIELRGVPKGVHEGGILDQGMGNIEVDCLVSDIPDVLHPNVAHLGVGESLLVKDLVLPPGVVALANPNDRIATVRVLGVEPEAPVVAVEGEEVTAEPERIGRIKKEEEPAES